MGHLVDAAFGQGALQQHTAQQPFEMVYERRPLCGGVGEWSSKMSRLVDAQAAYALAFGLAPPEPWGVDDLRIAQVLEQAVIDRIPLTESFDWWESLPPDGLA